MYQVKFTRDGKTFYGIARMKDSIVDGGEAKKAAKRGETIVEDAVLPVCYSVKDADLTEIKMELGNYDLNTGGVTGGDEFAQHVSTEHQKAREASAAITEGVGVGSMFSIGVGDGSAYYVVTKVNKKTCKVEWRGFCLDRWTDHHFGYGGTFPLADVARYVEGDRAMTRIFTKKK